MIAMNFFKRLINLFRRKKIQTISSQTETINDAEKAELEQLLRTTDDKNYDESDYKPIPPIHREKS